MAEEGAGGAAVRLQNRNTMKDLDSMSRGAISPWLLGLLLSASVGGAEQGTWKVVSRDGRENWLDLPKAAVVTTEDQSGKTWRQTGEMAVALPVAQRDFTGCLQRQGWKLKQVIPMGEKREECEILVFSAGSRKLLLMLADNGPGRCTFSLGEENTEARP